jgi:hypothetical protein
MLGTGAAFVTTTLANTMPGATPSLKLTYACAAVAFAVYAVGLAVSSFLPEPKSETLPE